MVDFQLSGEDELIVKTVREFLQKHVEPKVREIEYEGRIPREVLEKMGGSGLLAMVLPPEYGGSGASWLQAALAAYEIGYADPGMSLVVYFVLQNAWGKIVEKYGTSELKEEILRDICRGVKFLGIASTEPTGGSDVAGFKSYAKKVEGGYLVSGEKIFLSGVKEALEFGGGYVLIAKTRMGREPTAISTFYLPINVEGVETTLFETMGRKGISTGGLKFENVFLPERYRIGEEGRGFYYAFEGFNYARTLIAAASIGAARRMLEYTIESLKAKVVFEKPVLKFEGIQFPLVDHWAKLEAYWNLVLKTAWSLDRLGEGLTSRSEVNKLVASSKLLAVEEAYETVKDCLSALGAIGYTRETPVEMSLRGLLSYIAGAEGTPNIMRIILSREVLGREFLPYR